jgi:hypothetical protein
MCTMDMEYNDSILVTQELISWFQINSFMHRAEALWNPRRRVCDVITLSDSFVGNILVDNKIYQQTTR